MSIWDRLTGKVVDAAGLGQKKRAAATGIIAFDGPVGDLRLEIAIKSHPWLQNSAITSLLLAVWVAQALLDMAATLEAAAERQLGEADKLPEATFVLADQMYDAALAWIGQGQTALTAIDVNPDFELPMRLPTGPPRLDWIADAPPAHFVAVIQAVTQLSTSVEDALNSLQDGRSRLARKYDGAFQVIGTAMKVARAKLDQVEAAASDRQAVRLSQDIWAMLADVVRLYFVAGQQIARPALIDPKYDAVAQAAARARRLPPPPTAPSAQAGPAAPQQAAPRPAAPQPAGPARSPVWVGWQPPAAPRRTEAPHVPPPEPAPAPPTLGQRLGLAFDAWSLTDSRAMSIYKNDPARVAELEAFWRSDTNPQETYRIFELIVAAVSAGQVTARPGEFTKACPWTPTFVALKDVSIGTELFKTGQLFIFKVGPEGSYFGRGFDRLGFVPGTQRPSPKPGTGSAATSGPSRIDTRRRVDRAAPSRANAGPVVPSDIWLLTAAFQRPQRRANAADAEKMRQFWRADPDPAKTVAVHAELIAAMHSGSVRQHGDESLRECPWSQVYVAVSEVRIGGVQLGKNEKFALEVGPAGGTFRRGILRLGSIRTGT